MGAADRSNRGWITKRRQSREEYKRLAGVRSRAPRESRSAAHMLRGNVPRVMGTALARRDVLVEVLQRARRRGARRGGFHPRGEAGGGRAGAVLPDGSAIART